MASVVTTPAAVPASFEQEQRVSTWRQRRPIFPERRDVPRPWIRDRDIQRHGRRAASDPGASSIKRLMDIVGAGTALLFMAPFFAAVAIALKIESPGPVFFVQDRYGRRNRLFRVYKFRTMYTAASDRSGVCQTVANDPRVTPIGRILRLTSFDELPQLINVLKGEMSLVGPRPHVPGMLAGGMLYEDLVPYYFQRHTVRPGLTGLAQANGCRGSTTEPDAAITRVDYDLDYIGNWSLWLDCKIIVRTIRREFLSGSGI
jgi:polysaccharide biosynthesis protein PslA